MKTFNQFNEDARLIKSLMGTDFSNIESAMKDAAMKSGIKNKAPKIINKLSGIANDFKMNPKQASNFSKAIPNIVGQRMNLPTRAAQMGNKVEKGFSKMNEKLPGMIDKFSKMSEKGGKIEKGFSKMQGMINKLSK